MRRLLATAAAALALGLSGCGDSACQELGERICSCQPGFGSDACKNLIEDQLDDKDPGEGYCESLLGSCSAPAGAELCEWMLTPEGKRACGLAPPETSTP